MAEPNISFDNPVYNGRLDEYEEYEDNDATTRGAQTEDDYTNQETSFTNEDYTPAEFENQKAKEEFYTHLKSLKSFNYIIDENATLINKVLFVRDPRTQQVYAEYRNTYNRIIKVQLTYDKNPDKFLSLNTITAKNGVSFVRNKLGVTNYSAGVKPKIPPQI